MKKLPKLIFEIFSKGTLKIFYFIEIYLKVEAIDDRIAARKNVSELRNFNIYVGTVGKYIFYWFG